MTEHEIIQKIVQFTASMRQEQQPQRAQKQSQFQELFGAPNTNHQHHHPTAHYHQQRNKDIQQANNQNHGGGAQMANRAKSLNVPQQ